MMLSVGDFIDALSSLVVFHSCTYNVYHIDVLPDAVDVELGIGAVATENPYGLQAEQLFKYITVLTKVNDSVQLNVVTGSRQDSTLDDELLRGDDVSQLVEIQAAIEHEACHDGTENDERPLVGDAVMSCYEKEGAADDKRQALRDDVLRPVGAQSDNLESVDDVFHIPYRFIP